MLAQVVDLLRRDADDTLEEHVDWLHQCVVTLFGMLFDSLDESQKWRVEGPSLLGDDSELDLAEVRNEAERHLGVKFEEAAQQSPVVEGLQVYDLEDVEDLQALDDRDVEHRLQSAGQNALQEHVFGDQMSEITDSGHLPMLLK